MRPTTRHITGFTLTELLVSNAMLALVLALAMGSIMPSVRITNQAEAELAAQRGVSMLFDRLVTEMSPLDRASVTTAPDILSFLSDKAYTGTNSAIPDADLLDLEVQTPGRTWQKNVLLYLQDGNLWRREYPFLHGELLHQVFSDSLPILALATGPQRQLLVPNVELFEATPAGRSRVAVRIRAVHRNTDKPVAFESTVQVQMRGGR